MKKPRLLFGSALVVLASSLHPPAAIETDESGALLEESVAGEEAGSYARLRHLEGSVTARRDGLILEGLAENEPVGPGDDIITGADGRAEIQLADGSNLKLDYASRVILMSLPDGSHEVGETTIVQLIEGSMIVRTQGMDSSEQRFQIDTESASHFLLSDGVFRIDLRPDGSTSFSTRRGAAEVTASDVSVLVRGGQKVTARQGQQPSDPQVFNTSLADGFDQWAANVDASLDRRRRVDEVAPAGLPDPVQPYVNELSYHGRWSHYPSYGWAWRPVGVAANWQPYAYGRWTHCSTGLFWAGYEPWGWAPYHYGRWEFLLGTGWVWIPGSVFSGAYVAWGVAPGYFGWCPLGFYNYPVSYRFAHGYGSPWLYVGAHHIFERRVNTVIIRDVTVIREIERRKFVVNRPPRLDDRRADRAPRLSEELHRVLSKTPPRAVPERSATLRTSFREGERARQVKLNTQRRAAQTVPRDATPRQTPISIGRGVPDRSSPMRPGEVAEGKASPQSSRGRLVTRSATTGSAPPAARQVQPRQLVEQKPRQDQDPPRALQTPPSSQPAPRGIPRIIPPRKSVPREEVITPQSQSGRSGMARPEQPRQGGDGNKPGPQRGRGQQKQRPSEKDKPKQGDGNKDKN